MTPQNSPELLKRLLEARVEFVLIGGVAAIVHGSAAFTLDLDISAPLSEENCGRLLLALSGLHPRFALAANKRAVTEDAAGLSRYKNLYFGTDLGRLDVLASVEPIGDYAAVASNAIDAEAFGRRCRVLSLDDLITVKAHVARPKDKLVELELRAIREKLKAGG